MVFSTRIKDTLNGLLSPLNLRLDSLTAEKSEERRLAGLIAGGHFDKAPYALSPGMKTFDPSLIAGAYAEYAPRIERLKRPETNDVGYVYPGNTFYRSPDMEVLYCLVRKLAPKRVIEVGCGSSTRICRQAIMDGDLATRIIAIDPWPRVDIAPHVDQFIQKRLEEVDADVFAALEAGDVLFIDSSHLVSVGNDCARLFCDIIPALKKGVIVHVHDVFLPFDYPRHQLVEMKTWGEQYLLHALLQGARHELIWPGYYVQKMRPDLHAQLPFLQGNDEQSFWFRIA